MSIADKLTQIAENMQAVYEAGKAAGGGGSGEDLLVYATRIANLFENAVFPEGYEITITAPNALTGATIGYMFTKATGIRKITLNIPAGTYSSAHSFAYQTEVEEITFPDGIRFNNWNNFASSVKTLKSIFGRIDVSGSTNNAGSLSGCSALEDVSFMPNTIYKAFHIGHSSKLTDASIQSIIDGLADVTGGDTQKLQLHSTVGAKLTEEQKASATAKNWTLVY